MQIGLVTSTPILRCMTSVTAYAAFGGELADEIRRFDSTVTTGARWSEGGNPGAEGVIDYYEQFHGRPEGSRTYDASNLPALVYDAARLPEVCAPGGPTLTHGWLEAGQPVPSSGTPATPDNRNMINRYHKPLDRAAVAGELLTRYRYVAVLSASFQCDYDVS